MRQSRWAAEASPRARVSLVLGLVLLAGLLAGCDNSSTHTSGATPTPTAAPSPSPTTPPPAHGWNAVASPSVSPEGHLVGIAAKSASDAWAVGSYEGTDSLMHTLVEHWDGTQWTRQRSLDAGTAGSGLTGVAEIAANDVWAIGSQNASVDKATPLIEHYDGAHWSIAPPPSFGSASVTLAGISGSAANNVWAVGTISTSGAQNTINQVPVIIRWNGSAWSVVKGIALPSPQAGSSYFSGLSGVVAFSASNVWAVGAYPGQVGTSDLIEHWNGSSWSQIPGANPDPNNQNGLSAISADSASDLWAVGTGPISVPAGCGVANSALVEHWNGSHWVSTAPAMPASGQYGPPPVGLSGIAAVAPNNVWLVGGYLTTNTTGYSSIAPFIEHWNGSHWSITTSPNLATTAGLEGIAAASGTAWTVGQLKATNGGGPTLIEQLSGGQWAQATSASPGTVANLLTAVSARAANDVWAVGASAAGTLAEHWDGTQWSVSPTPNGPLGTNALNGVAAVSASDAWAVGAQPTTDGGLIEHWNGSAWTMVPAPAKTSALNAISADAANDVWAVGDNSIVHWNGTQWSSTPLPKTSNGQPTGGEFLGVVALAPNNVWAVGGNPPHSCGGALPVMIAHWDGHAWSYVPETTQGVLYGVAASGPNDVWAVGVGYTNGSGALTLHYNGKAWTQVSAATGKLYAGADLRGVAVLSPTDAWAVAESYGTEEIIEHWNGTSWSGVPAPGPGPGENSLLGVSADSASDIWAVGRFSAVPYYSASLNGPVQALIEHYAP